MLLPKKSMVLGKKTNPYKALNKAIKSFFTDLTDAFPTLLGVTLMSGSFTVLKKLNKKLPHKYFQELINIPYRNNIKTRDDTFFVNGTPDVPKFLTSQIDSLRNTWMKLDNENKKIIWDHLEVMVALNDKVIEYRQSKNKPSIVQMNDDDIVKNEGNDSESDE